ncbi:LacI family DNA-binding transcriptional regulator [Aliiglaciecola lipolytica]|uniref:LacI family transcriptional regulator n=1 Tax=Aliiglaciecola lipolytica E3 TaxID=1127673 RepID=K6XPW4_9ALTE|nr:LacI family DNA-binding transcriptional regulator [Aliiglaciecola lipolytica]GAC13721.1 LacI family transcriptional regulator [Aliiglaciecola lipolytica E3]
MVTIKQVASHAGVSFKTVSRVVNNDPTVKSANREKVLQSIQALGYRPNRAASLTRRKKSGIFGFIADDLLKVPYTFDLIRGAQQVAWENNKELMVLNVNEDRYTAEKAAQNLIEHRVEGIIYAAMYHHEVVLPDILQECPTILANCFCKNPRFPSIVPDEIQAAETVTLSLIDAGYKKIAFMNLNELIIAAQDRKKGVINAFNRRGVSLENLHIEPVFYGPAGQEVSCSREVTAKIVHEFKPDAIICGQDPIAVEAYFVLQSMGLQVGKDIGIASFDDWDTIPTLLQPALSTMALPHFEMGAWALEYLLNGREDKVHEKLPFTLVKRGSY